MTFLLSISPLPTCRTERALFPCQCKLTLPSCVFFPYLFPHSTMMDDINSNLNFPLFESPLAPFLPVYIVYFPASLPFYLNFEGLWFFWIVFNSHCRCVRNSFVFSPRNFNLGRSAWLLRYAPCSFSLSEFARIIMMIVATPRCLTFILLP